MIRDELNADEISLDIYNFLKDHPGMVVGAPSDGTTAIDADVDLTRLAAHLIKGIKTRKSAKS